LFCSVTIAAWSLFYRFSASTGVDGKNKSHPYWSPQFNQLVSILRSNDCWFFLSAQEWMVKINRILNGPHNLINRWLFLDPSAGFFLRVAPEQSKFDFLATSIELFSLWD